MSFWNPLIHLRSATQISGWGVTVTNKAASQATLSAYLFPRVPRDLGNRDSALPKN